MTAPGPAEFHNNLVSNPGRGVIWINEPYGEFKVRNNHIIARTTASPRTSGLFAFNGKSDFSKLTITDNIVECIGQPRALLRNKEMYAAQVSNNQLTNVTDADRFPAITDIAITRLENPLKFTCGANDEFTVDGWSGTATK